MEAQPPGPEAAAAAPHAAPARRAVSISTIHAAKGLEFPVVFVARWSEGYLPTLPRPDKDVVGRGWGAGCGKRRAGRGWRMHAANAPCHTARCTGSSGGLGGPRCYAQRMHACCQLR